MLNFVLMRSPLNWIIVFMMLLIWAFAFDLLHAYITDRHPADLAS